MAATFMYVQVPLRNRLQGMMFRTRVNARRWVGTRRVRIIRLMMWRWYLIAVTFAIERAHVELMNVGLGPKRHIAIGGGKTIRASIN